MDAEELAKAKPQIWKDLGEPMKRTTALAQPAPVQQPIMYLNPKVVDISTGKVSGSSALTWSDKPVGGWTMPVYLAAPVQQEAADNEGVFTTPHPLLNNLLQETYWLGKGPNNMDTGLSWHAALQEFLATLTPAAVVALQPTQGEGGA